MTDNINQSEVNQENPAPAQVADPENASPVAAAVVHVSFFKSLSDVSVENSGYMPWEELAAMLTTKRYYAAERKQVPLFNLARFISGSTCNSDNATDLSGLVLDIDGTMPLELVKAKLQDFEYAMYSTFRYTPELLKIRVVLPLSRPVSKAEWSPLWDAVNAMMDNGLDANTGDVPHRYWLPSCPPERKDIAFAYHNRGKILDPDELLSKFKPPAGFNADAINAAILGGITDRQYEPSSAALVANHCRQLKTFRDLRGGVLEPVWYAVGGVLAFCADGEALYQEWSSGYSGYNEAETADKLEQARARQTGPTTCAHFKKINAKGCEGCPYLGKITTPAQLGKSSSNQVVYSYDDLLQKIQETDDRNLLTGEIANQVALSGLKPSDIHQLRKKIAQKVSVPVSVIEADAKQFHRVEAQKDEAHIMAAQGVIDFVGAENIIFSAETFWVWRDAGVWEMLNDREIKQIILKVAQGKRLTKNVVESVLDMVKTLTNKADVIFNHNAQIINCRNGELHYENGTWVLKLHDRKNFQTTQIPVAYDADAECPRFIQFLGEIFANDADGRAKAKVVCEAFGYSLLKSCIYERFFLLIGSGANGKSVLLAVLAALLGNKNISAVQPDQFNNRFQRGHLQGKLANLITEIAEGGEIADAQLKSLVSGEMTTAEQKYKPPFDFIPFATMWFGTNHMPHTRDFSEALFRRAIILGFNNKFEGQQQDPHLKDKLLQELPGVLNMALLGLAQLIRREQFIVCPSSEAAKLDWKKEADQTAQFLDDECVKKAGVLVLSSALYGAYRVWAEQNGINRKLGRITFTKRLARHGIHPYKGAKGDRYLEGVELKPDSSCGLNLGGAGGAKIHSPPI